MDKLHTILYDSSLAITEQDTTTIEGYSSLQNYYRAIAPFNTEYIPYVIFYPTNSDDNVGVPAEYLTMELIDTTTVSGSTYYVYETGFPPAVTGSARANKIDVTIAFIVKDDDMIGVSRYDEDESGYNDTTYIAAQLLIDYDEAVSGNYVRVFNTETDWLFNGTIWADTDDVTVTDLVEYRSETAHYTLRKGTSTSRPTHSPNNTESIIAILNTKISSTEAYNSFYTKTDSDTRFVNVPGDTMTGDLTVPDLIADGIRLNGDTDIGEATWNSTDMTWEIKLNANVTLQLGQEEVLYAYNPSVTIADTQVVYISGASGQKPTVALASNDVKAKAHNTIGVATEQLTASSSGFVTTRGLVRNVDTSAWADGDVLYLGSNGAMTDTIPTSPLFNVQIGYVINGGSVGAGIIYVQVDKVHEIQEAPDVYAPSLISGHVLKWSATNSRFQVYDLDTALSDIDGDTTAIEARLDINESDIDDLEVAVALKAPQATTYTKIEVDDLVSNVYKAQGSVSTYADLAAKEATAVTGDVWNVLVDENTDGAIGVNYVWTGSAWDNIGGIEALATATSDGLMSQEDYSKLLAIESLAEVNIIEIVKVNGVAESVTSKAVDIFVPVKTSEIENDGNGSSVFVTANDLGNAGFGDMTELEYALNGIVGVADRSIISIAIPLTHNTTGQFYCDLASLVIADNNEIIFAFPAMTTDLTESITISLDGVAGTYIALKYDDTDNQVQVKHAQDKQITSTYDGTELVIKGDPLVNQEKTFDESIVSLYGDIKPINGQAQMNEINGLMLNQLVVNGDGSSISNWSPTAGSLSLVDDKLRFTLSSGSGNILQNISFPVGEYFISFDYKQSAIGTSSARYYVGATVEGYLTNDTAENREVNIFEVTTASTYLQILGYVGIGETIDFDNIIVIPITNTPLHSHTASEIDNIVQDYFEGTDKITNFELQSNGVQMFDVLDYDVDTAYSYKIRVKPSQDYVWAESVAYKLYDINETELSSATASTITTTSTTAYIAFINTITAPSTFILNEGTTLEVWSVFNSPQNFKAYADLLSVGTSIRDIAYPLNGKWWKKAYVGIIEDVAISDVIDTTAIPLILETTGVFYAVDTVNNEEQYGVYGDTLTLTGTSTVYYQLADTVDTEIETDGTVIQENNTTLIQVNNFATEYDISFSCNANALLKTLNDKIIYLQTEQDKLRWTDLTTPMTQSLQGNTSKPDYDFTNIGLLFPQNDTSEIVYTSFQFPHSYKEGSNIRPHIHMGQALDLQAVFKLEYVWVSIGETIGSWTTITLDQYAIEYVSGTLHQVLYSSTEIDGTGKGISSILKCKLYRDDNSYTGDVLVSDFDVHYQEDSNGSIQEYIK